MTSTLLRELAWIAKADAALTTDDDEQDHLLALSERLHLEADRVDGIDLLQEVA